MTLLEEFQQLLTAMALDLGPVFSTKMPASPDRCVVLARYGGAESSLADNYDEPRIQARVRGPATDVRIAERDAELVYDRLNGLGTLTLPGGTWLQLAVALQAGPVFIGLDSNQRPEYTVNLRCDVSRTSTNRSDP
ncbi:minor capsid protein [Nonomuraea lactucae]|uniref:minor capsid protein n=1 Tax=Nonomuraea lactucae TaxID=2249762 RepID=UPI000DE4256F|nr:minor capsid protein [Nonomuraea lactucae]